MIVNGILGFLTWPLLIIITYVLVRLALKHYESKLEELEDE
jgi:hypothetical protein